MFIGHFAVGFASKRAAPRASLGALLAAPLLADLLWPLFLLLGWERVQLHSSGDTPFLSLTFDHYPWSHSLLMDAVWALAFGGLYYAITRYRTGALVIAGGVLSHWVLDAISHIPDMPLAPWGGGDVGLGLWRSTAGTIVVESVMFVAGVWLYMRTTRARDGVGRWAWWALVALLALLYVVSLFSGNPPTTRALAVAALAGWLFPLWAWWLDRHRTADAT